MSKERREKRSANALQVEFSSLTELFGFWSFGSTLGSALAPDACDTVNTPDFGFPVLSRGFY